MEHRSKELKGFSSKYNCINLIYFEKHNSIEKAIERETQIKRWKRDWKNNLIETINPDWLDLAKDW